MFPKGHCGCFWDILGHATQNSVGGIPLAKSQQHPTSNLILGTSFRIPKDPAHGMGNTGTFLRGYTVAFVAQLLAHWPAKLEVANSIAGRGHLQCSGSKGCLHAPSSTSDVKPRALCRDFGAH